MNVQDILDDLDNKKSFTKIELNIIINDYYHSDKLNYNYYDYIIKIYNILKNNITKTYYDEDYFYNKILNISIKYGDYNTIKYLYNDKKRWLDNSFHYLIECINQNTRWIYKPRNVTRFGINPRYYYDIFYFMIKNGNKITEDIFDIIVNNYNFIFNQSEYNYDKDIAYQYIIIECLHIIFNSDNNFLFDNNIIKDKYNNIFKYQEYVFDEINLEDGFIEDSYYVYCPKHIIIEFIIDNKHYIDNNLNTFIHNYIDKLYSYKYDLDDLDNLDDYINEDNYKINKRDDNSSVFISIKKFINNSDDIKYEKFNKNLNRYLNIIYSLFNNKIYLDSLKYGVINDIFDKKLFFDITNDDFIIDHICVFDYCDKDIYNYLLEYSNTATCYYVSNPMDLSRNTIPDNSEKLNKINNILNKFIQ